jgi:hypothetical protein
MIFRSWAKHMQSCQERSFQSCQPSPSWKSFMHTASRKRACFRMFCALSWTEWTLQKSQRSRQLPKSKTPLCQLISACMLVSLSAHHGFAQSGMTPPQKPADVAPSTLQTPPEKVEADCATRLAGLGLETEPAPTIAEQNKACIIKDAIRLTAMVHKGRVVSFPDRPILDCRAAHVVGSWLRDLALPLAEAKLGLVVSAVGTGPGFECRNRNRAATGKLSAHAEGLAIDVAYIRFAEKTSLLVAKPQGELQKQLLDGLRKSACGWFTTVLGPGSDAAHADHLHLDVEMRGANGTSRFCQ